MKKIFITVWMMLWLVNNYSITECQEQNDSSKEAKNNKELEFYFAFTEATKLYLFGNLAQAVNLYAECLKYQPNNAAVHFQLSQLFLKAGETGSALEHAMKAYKTEPENKWYSLNLAEIFRMKQRNDSAVYLYEEMSKRNPNDISLLFMLSSLQEEVKNFDAALNTLNTIEQKIGKSKEIYINRFRIYNSLEKNELAFNSIKMAQLLDEEDYTVWGLMAEFYRKINKPDSASYCYKKMLNVASELDPTPKFSYAEFLLEQGKSDSALIVLSEVMVNKEVDLGDKANYVYRLIQNDRLFSKSKPVLNELMEKFLAEGENDIRVMSIYADVEYRLGNYSKSGDMLKHIIKDDPENYAAWEQLLFSMNFLGQVDSIIKYGSLATKILKERPVPYLLLGSAYYRKDAAEEAVGALEKGETYAQDKGLKFEFYSLMAECYMKLKNFSQSDNYFDKAIEIDNSNTGVRNNYAYYLALRKERLKFARKLSEYTVKKEPENSTFLDTYGWVLFVSGKTEKAKKYIEQALKNGGDKNSEVLAHYGDILFKLKRFEEAASAWKKALEAGNADEPEGIREKILRVEKILP